MSYDDKDKEAKKAYQDVHVLSHELSEKFQKGLTESEAEFTIQKAVGNPGVVKYLVDPDTPLSNLFTSELDHVKKQIKDPQKLAALEESINKAKGNVIANILGV